MTSPLRSTLPSALLLAALLVMGCDAVDTSSTADGPGAHAECALGMADADALAQIDALRDEVDDLETAGSLNSGQANALRNKLDNAAQKIGEGNYCPAAAMLRAFREQVGNFVADGTLDPADAAPLLEGADLVLGDGPSSEPVVLWDNGGMVTHPGAGAGGADVSMASTSNSSAAGSNVKWFPPDEHFRIADDFTVDPDGWHLSAIVTYAYETFAAVPSWTGFNANIWDGPPGDAGSTVVATTTTASIEFTGIYRIFPGAGNLGNTDRPVYAITWDLSGEHLAAGEYWVDWQVEGGTTAWAPYVMEPSGDSPVTVLGNGQQLYPTLLGGWNPILIDEYPSGDGVETPFQVMGSTLGPLAAPVPTPEALRAVPAPTTTALGSPQPASSQATDTQQQ